MKKVLVMAAMMLSSVGAFAQYEGGEFTIQPKIGENLGMLTNRSEGDASDADMRGGFVLGVEGEYHVSKAFGISAGVIYSQQGSELKRTLKINDYSSETKVTNKIDYINVPILANVYIAKGLALKAGIQPGFKVNSKNEVKISGDDANRGDYTNDLKAESVDFSIPMGISYEFCGGFCFDARYNLGLTKVWTENGKDVKNSVVQITFGYKFKL